MAPSFVQLLVQYPSDVHSPALINFLFCHCRSFSQRQTLADSCLALASFGATSAEIASVAETGTIPALMQRHNIDVSHLKRQGMTSTPRRPAKTHSTASWPILRVFQYARGSAVPLFG